MQPRKQLKREANEPTDGLDAAAAVEQKLDSGAPDLLSLFTHGIPPATVPPKLLLPLRTHEVARLREIARPFRRNDLIASALVQDQVAVRLADQVRTLGDVDALLERWPIGQVGKVDAADKQSVQLTPYGRSRLLLAVAKRLPQVRQGCLARDDVLAAMRDLPEDHAASMADWIPAIESGRLYETALDAVKAGVPMRSAVDSFAVHGGIEWSQLESQAVENALSYVQTGLPLRAAERKAAVPPTTTGGVLLEVDALSKWIKLDVLMEWCGFEEAKNRHGLHGTGADHLAMEVSGFSNLLRRIKSGAGVDEVLLNIPPPPSRRERMRPLVEGAVLRRAAATGALQPDQPWRQAAQTLGVILPASKRLLRSLQAELQQRNSRSQAA